MSAASHGVRRLARFGLITQGIEPLTGFYQAGLGFRRLDAGRHSGTDFERLMEVEGGADWVTLGLGDQIVEFLQFDGRGRPYPAGSSATDLIFQHLAIVVSNIDEAMARLRRVGGWRAISTAGPERLPAASGGVTAFKFRDPEGHPLELLAFPPQGTPAPWAAGGEVFLGIDHSAISISDAPHSIAFYEGLSLRVSGRSINRGPEQARLDGAPKPHVEVVTMAPPSNPPHVELLCYRRREGERAAAPDGADVAATRLIFEGDGAAARGLADPDGHRLLVV